MSQEGKQQLVQALASVMAVVAQQDLANPAAAQAALHALFPIDGAVVAGIRDLVRSGVREGWLCDRVNGDVRYSRLMKAASAQEWSIDAVHMRGAGGGHTHPNGEVDLCFAVEGDAKFDGRDAGWTVYAPGTWHVPTVAGGVMDILYFLPGGAIRFEEKPAAGAES